MPAFHVILACAILLTRARGLSGTYDQGPLALAENASLSWTLHRDTGRISLGLELADPAVLSGTARAWIAFGISENSSGSMLGGDIASAEFAAGVLDRCELADRHVPFAAYPIGLRTPSAPNVFPDKDACQDDGSWVLRACRRDPARGTAVLELDRALTAHDDQDRAVGPGPQSVIFAYGAGDFRYHGRHRGSARVVFFNPDGSYPPSGGAPLPTDISFSVDVVATNYSVPSDRVTAYACTAVEVPLPPSGKRFLVAADPLINPVVGPSKTHHFIVHACAGRAYAMNFTRTGACEDMLPQTNRDADCRAFAFGWAVGAGRFVFPDGVGLQIDATNNYLIMDAHYDNPDLAKDAVDASGARLYFADTRPIRAGVLALGDADVTLYGRRVETGVEYTSTCPSNCTATWGGDITVFASNMHMHRTGRKIYTNHFSRDGAFLGTVGAVEFWSNNHQGATAVAPARVVRAGDALSTTCVYDTRKLPGTVFGLATPDEMCADFLFYYPARVRRPGDGDLFFCHGLQLRGNRSATRCGARNAQSFALQPNPSLDDPVDTPERFGRAPPTCPGPTPGPARFDDAGTSPPPLAPSPPAADPACFPGAARVRTRRGVLAMRDVRAGDEVAVGGSSYSRVFMFTHREPRGLFDFVKLRTARRSLTLSAAHFLYVNGKLTAAGDARVGDALRLADGSSAPVVAVARTRAQGLYNPQTEHGDIVVDGVTASTYTSAVAPRAAHALLAPLRAAARAVHCRPRAIETEGPARRAAVALSRWTGSLFG